ncbi:MAG: thioredoxin domain-containing protein [Parvularculaceae bacterium]
MDRKLVLGAGALAVILLGGGAYWFMQSAPGEPAKGDVPVVADAGTCTPKPIAVTADDFTVGDASAPITIVEYFSQTCGACARFHSETFPKLNEAYIKTGVVRLVLRDYQRNSVDLAASVIGRCLARDSFLPFTNLLLEEQQTWMGREDQNIREGLKEMAKRAGMSADDFETCMKKEDEAKKLAAAAEQATKDYCIGGTPSLFLNGKKLEKAAAFDVLEAHIKDEMKALSVTLPDTKEGGAK